MNVTSIIRINKIKINIFKISILSDIDSICKQFLTTRSFDLRTC